MEAGRCPRYLAAALKCHLLSNTWFILLVYASAAF